MAKIIYDMEIMKIMSLFETITQAKLKDCKSDDQILFVVEENQIGKAIGKKGINVRKLESMINKRIKIVEFSADVLDFIRNFVYPLQIKEINQEDKVVTITGSDTKTRGMLIGRDAKNLRYLESVVKRYFAVDEIKVV